MKFSFLRAIKWLRHHWVINALLAFQITLGVCLLTMSLNSYFIEKASFEKSFRPLPAFLHMFRFLL